MMDVKRSDFDRAVQKLLGTEAYESAVVLTQASVAAQCDAVARAMLLGELASDDGEAIAIVRLIAQRLMRGVGVHGLTNG
ncbi:hypothetical protein KTE60_31105 [Burkholderia multivorans]|uniref:hypothetical protein n=1 Tax=Burkholderia multivorans TaxID=87883 RepID=UPI0019CF54F6|nr:hypothetical protein [Burkholderia multivorans]MBN6738894.1 hypothetical protein [Burkholderia multivorans]MBN7130445.1 hypothetical protein [Burkholderia multivorans]MBN8173367.1 hypothetical protein [Burkholderia multivorans]MBU9575923.1 hypothetical protein [Burkholderia multivorans]MBU9598383.1 hypothetical protein [Burkholderia multivorans]